MLKCQKIQQKRSEGKVTLEVAHPPYLNSLESKILHDLTMNLQKEVTCKKVAIYCS